MGNNYSSALTQEEIETLVFSLATARGAAGFTEADAEVILKWAHGVRVDDVLLDLILERKALVDVIDGEVIFKSLPP